MTWHFFFYSMYLVPLSPLHLEELPFQVHLGILSEQNLESANAGMVLIFPSTDQNWTKQFGTNTQFLPGGLFTGTFVTFCHRFFPNRNRLMGPSWTFSAVCAQLCFSGLYSCKDHWDNLRIAFISDCRSRCLFVQLLVPCLPMTYMRSAVLPGKSSFWLSRFPMCLAGEIPGVGSISLFQRERERIKDHKD
jgi:hypothetical protein